MRCQFNTVLLTKISQSIEAGRPLWALLMANEYLEPGDPMRRAFVIKAKRAMRDRELYKLYEAEILKVFNGQTLHQLGEAAEGIRLLSEVENHHTLSQRYIPPEHRTPYAVLKAQRNRRGHQSSSPSLPRISSTLS